MTKYSHPVLQIIVNNKPVQVFYKDLEYFIAGKPGTEYSIRVHNPHHYLRAEAIISVDGNDVFSGKSAGEDCNGYIIPPNSHIDIHGFRISDSTERKFVFSDVANSYAAKKSAAEKSQEPLNIGVIGCLMFHEKDPYSFVHDYTVQTYGFRLQPKNKGITNYSILTGGYSLSSTIPDENQILGSNSISTGDTVTRSTIGTSMGDKVESKITYTTFKRDPNTKSIYSIYYDVLDNLVAKGIVSKTSPVVAAKPNPFPSDINYFCPEY